MKCEALNYGGAEDFVTDNDDIITYVTPLVLDMRKMGPPFAQSSLETVKIDLVLTVSRKDLGHIKAVLKPDVLSPEYSFLLRSNLPILQGESLPQSTSDAIHARTVQDNIQHGRCDTANYGPWPW